MHPVNAPSDEANTLYVEQSFLAARLVPRQVPADELVIWDVGLGAAFNAMAVIRCFERCYAQRGENALRSVRLVSFECDLDPLTLAANNPGSFPHLRHGAPCRILANGRWEHPSRLLHWELLRGDFRDRLAAATVPDLIFYDPFSAKTDSALWAAEVFARIFQHCAPKSAELYTYSAATAVRAALLTAGFFVAEGVGTGPKSATTIAFTRATGAAEHPLFPRLLGQRWLTRWRRSEAQFPPTLTTEGRSHVGHLIETHPQFCGEAERRPGTE